MFDANQSVDSHDVLLVTLDTLRYDVAQEAFESGELPNLSRFLPASGWELRHTPGNFTFAAHQAFFAGFLPTPADPNANQERLFAAKFLGSETSGSRTCVFDSENIIEGFAGLGFHTICIGGVGFFNKRTPLGNVLPSMFAESHWDLSMGVTTVDSMKNQIDVLKSSVANHVVRGGVESPLFTFINIAAIHQPNCIFLDGHDTDSRETMRASLRHVDEQFEEIFKILQSKRDTFCIVMSDHGTAYGEDGYWGHRVSHETVWNVPYAEFVLNRAS